MGEKGRQLMEQPGRLELRTVKISDLKGHTTGQKQFGMQLAGDYSGFS